MRKQDISPAVIKRLPRYYRYLENLMEEGIERVSSMRLAEIMNITASQMRQDLNQFGGFGQQGYGYNVKHLHEEIGKILNINTVNNLIIIGAGNLGQCLANYAGFKEYGFHIRALFDKDPDKVGKSIGGLTVLPMDQLESKIKEENIHIAALCVPRAETQELAEQLIQIGVKGLWNFANIDLEVPEDVVVESVRLSDSLMCLCYGIGRLNEPER